MTQYRCQDGKDHQPYPVLVRNRNGVFHDWFYEKCVERFGTYDEFALCMKCYDSVKKGRERELEEVVR